MFTILDKETKGNVRLIVLLLNKKNKELGIQIAKVEVFSE